MGYIRADAILPEDIIRQIQQYADGVSIYIPRREDERTPWGAQSGIRREIAERKSHVLLDHLAGMSAAELAERYFLSEKSIHRIIRNMKK